MISYNPVKTPIDHPMGRAVVRAAQKTLGKEPLIYPVSGGSAPTGVIAETLGIPVIGVPYANADESNHAPNDNLRIDHFLRTEPKITPRF